MRFLEVGDFVPEGEGAVAVPECWDEAALLEECLMARKYTGRMTATMRRTKPPRAERMMVLRRDLEALAGYTACFSER
jgi:hypothetical protein